MRLDGATFIFPGADNKEIHNKAMQPIENQSPALLALYRQMRVSEADKAVRQCTRFQTPPRTKVCRNDEMATITPKAKTGVPRAFSGDACRSSILDPVETMAQALGFARDRFQGMAQRIVFMSWIVFPLC